MRASSSTTLDQPGTLNAPSRSSADKAQDWQGDDHRERSLGALVYNLKKPIFALPFYGMSLTGGGASELRAAVGDTWPGDAETGAALLDGQFPLAGQSLRNPTPLWAPAEGDEDWRRALHGFGWLRDLRALGGDAARRQSRELVSDWIDHCAATWQPLVWDPEIIGRRLANWIGHYDFFAASADIGFRHRLLHEVGRQSNHLARALPAGLGGMAALAALKGLILAGAGLPNGDRILKRGLGLLSRELPRQLLADGGHAERSPERLYEVLRDLVDLRAALHAANWPAPETLQDAIDHMAPTLRLLQHGDSGLALFNDSTECAGWQVDNVLQRAGARGRLRESAPSSGFQRLQAGRALVLVDAGAPPPPGLDRHAHAGTLSFEMSIGRERLIVNCGAHRGSGPWRRVQRLTAAHSTLVLDEVNSAEVGRNGGLRRRPERVICRREEADGNHWLEMSHDGYRRRFGQVHRRRLYLAANGEDLRGEDRLEGDDGEFFAVHFHLHPNVKATLTQSGETVLLRLTKGGGWRFRAEGAHVHLEESIYLGQPGERRRCQQIVLRGPVKRRETRIKWSLRREAKA